MASPAGGVSPFVFPGSAPRVRKLSLDGSRERENDDVAVTNNNNKPMENPLLHRKSPTATQSSSSLLSSSFNHSSPLAYTRTFSPTARTAAAAATYYTSTTNNAVSSRSGLRQRRVADSTHTTTTTTAMSLPSSSTTTTTANSNDNSSSAWTTRTTSVPAPPPKASWSLGTAVASSLVVGEAKQNDDGWLKHTSRAAIAEATLSTGGNRESQLSLAPYSYDNMASNTRGGCWVLVYGYTDSQQCHEILRRCSEWGHVVDHRYSLNHNSNWMLVQYSSPLQAAKALGHAHVQLENGTFCGIKELKDNDPILVQWSSMAMQQKGYGAGGRFLWTASSDSIHNRRRQDEPPGQQSQSDQHLAVTPLLALDDHSNGNALAASLHGGGGGGIHERDILLTSRGHHPDRRLHCSAGGSTGGAGLANDDDDNNTSFCEKLLRWILSVRD